MKKKDVTVEVQQVKRHKRKPSVTISLDLAKKMIDEAGTEIQKGHAYHVYECGHVLDNEEDERTTKYVPDAKGHSRVVRVCPICWENLGVKSRLLTKYKKCACNAEHNGIKVQSSLCCAECPSIQKETKKPPKYLELFNEGKRDTSRWNCIHRKDCIDEYIVKGAYEALPCKGCEKYEVKEGVWY